MDRFAMGRFAASLRADRGLSADDLACFIGSTPRRLLALENGRGMLPPDSFRALADYLNVERSALSKELGRMRNEGILTFRKNHFQLHRTVER